jgi:2-dehydropantoate 2-reductase
MGSLFAARLSAVAEVCVLGSWKEQIAALNQGLELIGADGRRSVHRIPAFHLPEETGPADHILVFVKSYQTARAADQAHFYAGENSALKSVLTLQNGAGNLEQLADSVGESRAFLGITTQAARMIRPGIVEDAGPGPLILADRPGLEKPLREMVRLYRAAGFEVRISGEVPSLVWGKLAVNAGINPLTAILNVPNGLLAEKPEYREWMIALALEAETVAAAMGIRLPFPDTALQLLTVAKDTARNQSSMLTDVLRGAPTEIDAITGEVIRKGDELGVETPLNRIVYQLVRKIETGALRPGELSSLDQLRP